MTFARQFLLLLFIGLCVHPVDAQTRTFAVGDVFAALKGGYVGWYDSNGRLIDVLDAQTPDDVVSAGMAFDQDGNLYVTLFNGQAIAVFDNTGIYQGTFGSGFGGFPESIVFNDTGELLAGTVDGTNDVLRFSAAGVLIDRYDVETEDRGSDWIELADDQCTLYYTSEDRNILRYDVCEDRQLSRFASLSSRLYALRLLPDGGMLVANEARVLRLDRSGNILTTYDASGEDFWFAMNRDPDGISFWSGDITSGNFYRFNIETGEMLLGPINACNAVSLNLGADCLSGLAVYGELTAARLAASVEATLIDPLLVDADANGIVSPGDTLEYEVVITNISEEEALGVTYDPAFDTNVQYLAGSATTTLGTINVTGTSFQVDIGSLAPGESVTIIFRAVINASLDSPFTIITAVGLIAGENVAQTVTDDPDTASALDETETVVFGHPLNTPIPSALYFNPTITFLGSIDGVGQIGDVFTLNVDFVNNGVATCQNVSLLVHLPQQVTVIGTTGGAVINASEIRQELPVINPQERVELEIRTQLDALPQDRRLTAFLTLTSDDPSCGEQIWTSAYEMRFTP